MDKKTKIFGILMTTILLVGLFITVFYITMNVILIDNNTNTMKSNKDDLYRVSSINEDETIFLESPVVEVDGTNYYYDEYIINEDDVEGFVKVKMGSGTWYDKSTNYLFTETTIKDLINLYGILILYIPVLGIMISKVKVNILRVVFRGLALLGVGFLVLVFCLYVL